jgi:hypothetical protein
MPSFLMVLLTKIYIYIYSFVITIAGMVNNYTADDTGELVGGYRDGHVSSSMFNCPTGICVGEGDKIFISDFSNHCIRCIHLDQVFLL